MKNKKVLGAIIAIIVIITGIFMFNSRKITYTKEFTYHPKYKNMEVQKSEPAKKNTFGNAIYKVKGAKYESYLKDYEKVLKRDGWNIIKYNKPSGLEATKDNHITRINVVDCKEYLTVLIWTK